MAGGACPASSTWWHREADFPHADSCSACRPQRLLVAPTARVHRVGWPPCSESPELSDMRPSAWSDWGNSPRRRRVVDAVCATSACASRVGWVSNGVWLSPHSVGSSARCRVVRRAGPTSSTRVRSRACFPRSRTTTESICCHRWLRRCGLPWRESSTRSLRWSVPCTPVASSSCVRRRQPRRCGCGVDCRCGTSFVEPSKGPRCRWPRQAHCASVEPCATRQVSG